MAQTVGFDGVDIQALRGWLARRVGAEVGVVETHLSWVLLAGEFAYKLKKPLALPFVDATQPAQRLRLCEEELRLNRRLAPDLYLDVCRITGGPQGPCIDGDGPVLDHAVRMRRFAAGSLFSERAVAGTLVPQDVDRLAARLGAFHTDALRADAATAAAAAAWRGPVALACCDAVAAALPGRGATMNALRDWLSGEAGRLAPAWRARAAAGRVRECHGDLHLANLLVEADGVTAFDGIEFDPALRWIDIVDDAAFAAMDLRAHRLPALATRFANAWIDATGDFDGIPLWRFALVARALVRAQVAGIRRAQGGPAGWPHAQSYLRVAATLALAPRRPRLLITHGLPGSGKSALALALAERIGALRLRSDVLRRRLHDAPTRYADAATRSTYAALREHAGRAIAAGWPVVVDAAFLQRGERDDFAAAAQAWGVPFAVLDLQAPLALLHERVRARRARGDDPSEADGEVLERLAARQQPLAADELLHCIAIDAARPLQASTLAARCLAFSAAACRC